MPLPLLIPAILVATTVASLATPFLFPSPQDKANIELNNKLKEGNFTITKTQPKIKTPDFTSKIETTVDEIKTHITKPENSLMIMVIILAIIGVLIFR